MDDDRLVTFFLEDGLRESAQAGQHNFINLMIGVLEKSRFRVEFAPLEGREAGPGGPSLTHMASPPDEEGLVFRRVYHYPFWQIDAVAQRWHWDVARAPFEPGIVPADAARFFRFWQKRLFGDAAAAPSRDGFVYVPLQGLLRQQRPFQACTPLEMVEHVLTHAGRNVVATLHPKEDYSALDLAALRALAARHRHLTIATGEMERHLATCDYVVTQNSGVAFSGYFFRKPALLFAPIDFHHIAIKADLTDLEQCFSRVAAHRPDYERYLWWFWQDQCINAGRDDASDKIAARLRRFGWSLE